MRLIFSILYVLCSFSLIYIYLWVPYSFKVWYFFYHRFILAKVVTKRFHIETPSFQILIALFVNDISPYVYFNNYSSRRVQLQEGINRKIFIWADEVSLKHKIVKTWNFMVKNSSRLITIAQALVSEKRLVDFCNTNTNINKNMLVDTDVFVISRILINILMNGKAL